MNRAIFDDDYGEQLGAVLKSRLRYYAGVNKSPAQGVTLLRSEEFEVYEYAICRRLYRLNTYMYSSYLSYTTPHRVHYI